MKNRSELRDRYMRDELSVRLGGLAANLARIESFSKHPDHKNAVEQLLVESKYFIEWSAPEAALDLQSELVDLQRRLAGWESDWNNIWTDPARRDEVASEAGEFSRSILERSGLLQARH